MVEEREEVAKAEAQGVETVEVATVEVMEGGVTEVAREAEAMVEVMAVVV